MADKKKNTNQSSTRRQSQSQLVAPATRNGNRARKSTNQSRVAASTARNTAKAKENTTEQSELVTPVSSGEEKEQSKVVKTATRERDERKDQQSKVTGRRDSNKSQSKALPEWQIRLLNNRYARFVRDAYYELRHKVTWPSFNEARNMTIVVILLSLAVGVVLWIADQGLFQLFILVGGR